MAKLQAIHLYAYREEEEETASCSVLFQPLVSFPHPPAYQLLRVLPPSSTTAMSMNSPFLAIGCSSGDALIIDLRSNVQRYMADHSQKKGPIIDICIASPHILLVHPPDVSISIHPIPFSPFTHDFGSTLPPSIMIPSPLGAMGPVFFSVSLVNTTPAAIHLFGLPPFRDGLACCTLHLSSKPYHISEWVQTSFPRSLFLPPSQTHPSLPERPHHPGIVSTSPGITTRVVSCLAAMNSPETPLVLSEIVSVGGEMVVSHKRLRIGEGEDENLGLNTGLNGDVARAAWDEVSGRVFLFEWDTELRRVVVLQF